MDMVTYAMNLLSVAVLCHVTCVVAFSLSCDLLYVKGVAFACNKYLSQIQIEVLAGTRGHYNTVCSAFDEYIRCLEPHLGYCKQAQYSTTRDYFNEKAKFSSAPYNCTIPPTVYTFKGIKQEVTHDKMPSDHDKISAASSQGTYLSIVFTLVFRILGSVT